MSVVYTIEKDCSKFNDLLGTKIAPQGNNHLFLLRNDHSDNVLRQRMMVAEFVARQHTIGSPINGETPNQNHNNSNMPATHGATNNTISQSNNNGNGINYHRSTMSPELSIGASGHNNSMMLQQNSSPMSPESPSCSSSIMDGIEYPPGTPQYELQLKQRKDLFTQRKQREFIPDNKKDDSYWDRRRRNNEAAKRSREKRRYNDMVLEQRVVELTKENHVLKAQLDAIKDKYNISGENLVSVDQIMATLPTTEQVLSITKRVKLAGSAASTSPDHRSSIIYQQPNQARDTPSPVPTSVIHQNLTSGLLEPLSPVGSSGGGSNSPRLHTLQTHNQHNHFQHQTQNQPNAYRLGSSASSPQRQSSNGSSPSSAGERAGFHHPHDGGYLSRYAAHTYHHSQSQLQQHHHHQQQQQPQQPQQHVARNVAACTELDTRSRSVVMLPNGQPHTYNNSHQSQNHNYKVTNETSTPTTTTQISATSLVSNICYANASQVGVNILAQTPLAVELVAAATAQFNFNNSNVGGGAVAPFAAASTAGDVLNLSRRRRRDEDVSNVVETDTTSPFELSSNGTGSGTASGDDEHNLSSAGGPSSAANASDLNNSLPLKLRHKSHLGDKDAAATALLSLQNIKQEPGNGILRLASPSPWDGDGGSSDERDSGISIGGEWTRKILAVTATATTVGVPVGADKEEENIHLKSQIARLESEVANIKSMIVLSTTSTGGAAAQ